VRVGEAGAGFAAVADEVKNLALRATEAAKNIANLIESTDKKVEEGSELLENTGKEFREVTVSVGRSSELIGKIGVSSLEQVQGTELVNMTMSEMDKVVQQNAFNARESALASEEMNAQVYQMQDFVEVRKSLADGSRDNGTTGSNKVTGKKRSARNPVKITVLEKKIVGCAPRGKMLGERDRSS
jgi:methyl-accepting chemotaxis protein